MVKLKFVCFLVMFLVIISCKEETNVMHMGRNLSGHYNPSLLKHMSIHSSVISIQQYFSFVNRKSPELFIPGWQIS